VGFKSIRVVVFLLLVRQTLTHSPLLPELRTSYVETTQESLPVNIGEVGDEFLPEPNIYAYTTMHHKATIKAACLF
jgi:hypothetical protein